jgi:hypothetical protein
VLLPKKKDEVPRRQQGMSLPSAANHFLRQFSCLKFNKNLFVPYESSLAHAWNQKQMSIFIKIDILKPSLIQHFKKKISIIINFEQKKENYAIYNIFKSYNVDRMILRGEGGEIRYAVLVFHSGQWRSHARLR